MASDLYDVFAQWLKSQTQAEIVFLQELHWGCGRTEGSWKIDGWQIIVSADPHNRYSGVGICIHPKLVATSEITQVVCIPGRILHVQCKQTDKTLDLVSVYQWVWQAHKQAEIEAKRQRVWTALGNMLQRLPQRHLLIIGADLNSKCCSIPGLVGRGLLKQARQHADPELAELLTGNSLVMANSWGSARPAQSHTFSNGDHRSQLDFILVRRGVADRLTKEAGVSKKGPPPPEVEALVAASDPTQAIYDYFSKAFSRSQDFQCPPLSTPITYDEETIKSAISRLKLGKAVPKLSVPAEIWRLCPDAMARKFCSLLEISQAGGQRLPEQVTDCSLALLPKPNKAGRQPQDLRPIGACTVLFPSGRPVPEAEPSQPLLEEPDFQASCKRNWKEVFRTPRYALKLKNYCAICNQWISMKGPGTKQHIRLMHKEHAELHAEAVARQTTIGLVGLSPCRYCAEEYKNPRARITQQMTEDAQPSLAAKEVTEFFGGKKDGDQEAMEAEESWDQEGRKPKWRKPEWGQGKGSHWWGGAQKRGWEAAQSSGQTESAMDSQTVELLKALTKLSLKHEAELGRLRPDLGFMAFFDVSDHGYLSQLRATALDWQEKCEQGLVKSPLRHILFIFLIREFRTRLQALMNDEEKLQKAHTMEWLVEGNTALNPRWQYFQWNPTLKAQEVAKDTPPIGHMDLLSQLDILEQHVTTGNNLTRFQAVRGLEEESQNEVEPFMISFGFRDPTSHQCHAAMTRISGCAATKILGFRVRPERAARQPRAKLVADAYLQTKYCDWKPSKPRGQRQTQAANK
ncbi:unnamed protein product [Symbiodinium sp. CCMP2592]|nr:unnamed protein product [Symbiodinium sp. CCMP2592]